MNKANALKLVLALALLAGAAFLLARFLRRDTGVAENTFFYDLSEKKLFAAPREALPPIRGLNDAAEDAVRAVVIAPNGNPEDRAGRKIAYLEKYAPELKQHLELVRAGKAEPLPSKARNALRFVKRVDDADWRPLSSPEGEKILAEWNVAGPDGRYPVVCAP
jgi:hypothetical protein